MELTLPQVRKELLPLLDREKSHGYQIIMDYPNNCLWLTGNDGTKIMLVNRQEINAGLWGVASVRIGKVLAE